MIDRWQRMLSGFDSRTRLYFYLLRRPIRFAEDKDGATSSVAALGRRKRHAFLSERVQSVSAYVAWAHDPGLSAVTTARTGGPWWTAYVKKWMARRRNQHESVYLHASIEAAAASFRQLVEASRALVDDLTPVRVLDAAEASLVLNELTNRPGSFWDGATGSGMNWRLAVSELEAERRNLRLTESRSFSTRFSHPQVRPRPIFSKTFTGSKPPLTVSLEWRPQRLDAARRKIRGAQRHYFSKRYSMAAHVQETEGTAVAMEDTAAAVESDRLGNALIELEADGIAYGGFALTVAIHGELSETESLDGDIRRIFASHDAKVIRGGLRATSRLVFAHARATQAAAGPVCLCIGGSRRVYGPDLRAAGGNAAQRPLEESGLGRAGNPMADPLPLRSVPGRRGPHAGAGRDRRG